jgi:hypothetical protein
MKPVAVPRQAIRKGKGRVAPHNRPAWIDARVHKTTRQVCLQTLPQPLSNFGRNLHTSRNNRGIGLIACLPRNLKTDYKPV